MGIFFAFILAVNTGYGEITAIRYDGGNRFMKEQVNMPRYPCPKSGAVKSGDPHNIDILYQGNSEVDLCEFTYSGGWPYKVFRDGLMIAEFNDDGPMVYRDTTVVKGQTYSYQIKVYCDDTLVSESNIVNATTGEVCGQITQNTTWKLKDSPFTIKGSLPMANNCVVVAGGWGTGIPAYPKLTIEPGVQVIIDNYHALGTTHGNLEIIGKVDSMIKFTSSSLSPGPSPGVSAVIIQDSTQTSTISWAIIENAIRGVNCNLEAGNVSISNCWILNDSTGIRCYNGQNISISNTFIGDCDVGVFCDNNTIPQISSSEIAFNKLGVFAMSDALPTISNSNFCGNKVAAISNNTASQRISAKNCWWGYPGGPTHTNNPKGEGDKIYGDVDYVPFEKNLHDFSFLPLPDFRVDTIIVMQTIDSVDLLAARPTMVRVFLSPGRSKAAEFPYGIQVWLGGYPCAVEPIPDSVKYKGCWNLKEVRKGSNSVNGFITDKNSLPSLSCSLDVMVQITAALGEERDNADDNNEDTLKVFFKPPAPEWRVFYTALRVGDWWSDGSGPPASEIEQFATNNQNFLEGVFPARLPSTFRGYSMRWLAFTRVGALAYLKTFLALTSGNALAVGIVPLDFIDGDVGVMNDNFLSLYHWTCLVSYRNDFPNGDYWGPAHEIGHSFGLPDEYQAGNPNWNDTRRPYGHMATNGWWVKKRSEGCIYNARPQDSTSALNSYSFMGNTRVVMHWIPKCNYNILYNAIVGAKNQKSVDNRLLVNLSIYKNDSVFAMPFYEIGTGTADTGTYGDYSLECLNVSNATLSSVKFTAFLWEMDTTAGVEVFPACVALEYPSGTKKVTLKHNSNIIYERTLSSNPPIVNLISPNGEPIADSIKVVWSATDPDGDILSYALLSKSSNDDWSPITFNLKDTSCMVHSNMLSGSTASFKVIATDGFRKAEDSSDVASGVSNRAPFVFISAPAESSSFAYNQEMSLLGDAIDPEDKTLPESSLVWISSIDDTIGFGYSVNKTLSIGTHKIRLKGKDSNGAVGSDSLFLFVVTDTLPDLSVSGNEITTNIPPAAGDTCWISTIIRNTIRDASCVVSIYLNGLDSSHLLASDTIWVEANKSAMLNAMWVPEQIGGDTIWVKISDANPPESDTTNNISSKVFPVVGVEEIKLPNTLFLSQNKPNPAFNSVTISFGIPASGKTSLKIYDAVGRLVKTLYDKECKAGWYNIKWDAHNNSGTKCSNGIYFIRLHHNTHTITRKAVLLK